jgi:hypothetical protein
MGRGGAYGRGATERENARETGSRAREAARHCYAPGLKWRGVGRVPECIISEETWATSHRSMKFLLSQQRRRDGHSA